MTSCFDVRIHILSREVGYFFWVWMNSDKCRKRQLFNHCTGAIIKLLLAYGFRKIFFIVQDLKHVHLKYLFLELFGYFWNLYPDPGPWNRTLDPDPGPWTRTLKNLDPEKPGLWKPWTLKNLDPEKHGINIGLKNVWL